MALKTAMPGVDHKSDRNGVMLNLTDREEPDAAYTDMVSRLGPRVTVAAMAPQGVEMAFGALRDAQFGVVVMVSPGGVMLEWMDDKVFAMLPFGPVRATISHRRSGCGIRPIFGDDREP